MMEKVIIVIMILLSHNFVNSQNKEFIDSLKCNKGNEIIVFKTNCAECIILNQLCKEKNMYKMEIHGTNM